MAVQETPIKKLTHNNAVDAEIVEHNGRFVIVNGKNGEIIENCNGWGYKTREKALKFLQANFDYKPKNAELIKDNVDSAVKEWKVYDCLASDKGAYLKTRIGSYIQIPLKLVYAITIHKSQGQTYSRVNVQPAGWSNGLLYVSLSRCRKVDSMYLSWRKNLIRFC